MENKIHEDPKYEYYTPLPNVINFHAEKCPVCNGAGRLPGDYNRLDYTTSFTVPPSKICHGCNGIGWIEVRNS